MSTILRYLYRKNIVTKFYTNVIAVKRRRVQYPTPKKWGYAYTLYPTNDACVCEHLLTVAVYRYFTVCEVIFVYITSFCLFIFTM